MGLMEARGSAGCFNCHLASFLKRNVLYAGSPSCRDATVLTPIQGMPFQRAAAPKGTLPSAAAHIRGRSAGEERAQPLMTNHTSSEGHAGSGSVGFEPSREAQRCPFYPSLLPPLSLTRFPEHSLKIPNGHLHLSLLLPVSEEHGRRSGEGPGDGELL